MVKVGCCGYLASFCFVVRNRHIICSKVDGAIYVSLKFGTHLSIRRSSYEFPDGCLDFLKSI